MNSLKNLVFSETAGLDKAGIEGEWNYNLLQNAS